MSYFRATVYGLGWMAALRIVNRGLGIVRIAFFARILTPGEFGNFGVGLLILGLLELASDTGVNVFLIQSNKKISEYLDSAWVVSIARGILIGLILFLLSPFVKSFFSLEDVKLLTLISIVPVIRGFINPAIIVFQKELQFKKEFFRESFLFIVETFTALGVGIVTKNATAFVWGMIASAFLEVIISFTVMKFKPRFKFERKKLLIVIHRGKWVAGSGIFDYLFTHLDDIVVGRLLGTFSLGLYQNAYKIATLLVIETERVFNKVTFPIYKYIDKNGGEAKKAFWTLSFFILVIILPVSLLLILFAKQIILVILGPNWLEAVGILKILVIYAFLRAMVNSFSSLFFAKSRQEIVLYINFVSLFVLLMIIVPMVNSFGMKGAAYSTIIAVTASLPVTLYFLKKTIKEL